MQSVQIYFRFNKIPEQPNNKGGKDNSYFPLATLGPPASQVATISMEVNTDDFPSLDWFLYSFLYH